MKILTELPRSSRLLGQPTRPFLRLLGWAVLLGTVVARLTAQEVTIASDDFEAYTGAATSLSDTNNANPATPSIAIADDTPVGTGAVAGSGVQLINWLAHSGSQSLLLRSGTEAQLHMPNTRSGPRYQLDFWLYVVKGAGNRSFFTILRAMGADSNGDDLLAYQSDRAANRNIRYYDGVGSVPAANWVQTGVQHVESTWQHHRFVIDMAAQKFHLFIDDMDTAVVTNGDLSRPDVPVPTMLIIRHEGDSADDGYFAIDDLSLTVTGSTDLASTFRDGFESYAAVTNVTDDADPQGVWVTVETQGTGGGKDVVPTKVQVVGTNVVIPHSGQQCLKLEGGQRAGVSFAWGVTPLSDVQITWWARVPASVRGTTANYLRMSLYGVENGSSYAGDSALLGYGSRDASVGDETSLTYYTTAWVNSGADYTPDTWEEYRLTTHNHFGQYTIIKNPSSGAPEIIVERAALIGTATNWGPTFLVAWSSSNGSGHPPVYVDDIEILSLTSNPNPLPEPYTVAFHADRFTNATVLKFAGPVGDVAVDPRDNTTILFAVDAAAPAGGIYRARKVASGHWTIDPQPVVANLDRPSGLVLAEDGTLWWTHDFTMSLMRLRAPWESNVAERIIANFGPATTDDDPIDLTIAPATFGGALASAGMILVADRGSDGDSSNAVFFVDAATTQLDQAPYESFLVPPTIATLGTLNVNAIAPLALRGEVVTVSEDGYIAAINGDGAARRIVPTALYSAGGPVLTSAVAVDPTTGRIWVADDALDQVWSIDSTIDPFDRQPDRQELSFPLTNPSRPDRQIDIHDPGMTFAPDGSVLVLSDTSTADGNGRLLIFHNEAFTIPTFRLANCAPGPQGVELQWQAAGNVAFRVLRATNLTSSTAFQDISGELRGTRFTDTNAPAGQAFYRIEARPQ
ncbi:MAG: hypothetical protein HZA90_04165 [Verrucomicrobia bacterium]|nr:hypothetical protein [Verrucomicrobiota bacterium]